MLETGGLLGFDALFRGTQHEQVVEGALEPLVYAPGPAQTADRARWRPRSSAEILALRVADIAMGSARSLLRTEQTFL